MTDTPVHAQECENPRLDVPWVEVDVVVGRWGDLVGGYTNRLIIGRRGT